MYSTSNRRIRYTAQNVIDHFDGIFDIPCDGVDSDIEGFESDDSDFSEADEMVFSEAEDDGIDLPRFPDEENEDEENDTGEETRQRGLPVCFSFEDHDWSDQRSDIEIPEFQEQVGPANILSAESSAKDFFSLLVDDRMLNNIVRETNKYAKQKLEDSGKDLSLSVSVNLVELKAFLGLFIAMGFHALHSVKDYWSEDWILGVPAFAR